MSEHPKAAEYKTAEAALTAALVRARAEGEAAGYRRAIDEAYGGLTTLLHSFAGEGEVSAYVAGATDGINAARGEVRSLIDTNTDENNDR